MSSYKSKLRKYVVYKFLRISISVEKNDLPTAPVDGLVKPTLGDERCIKKLSEKRMRGRKARKCKVSALAGCGCQSGRSSVIIGPVAADSRMPEVCSVQSLPSCSSAERRVEKCTDWMSNASFDEMIKWSSSSHDQDNLEYQHNHKSSPDVHISPVKFNELVSNFRRSEQISTPIVLSAGNAKADQVFDANPQSVARSLTPPKLNSLHRPLRQTLSDRRTTFLTGKMVQSNVERSTIISTRKGTLMESLLIMKSSCDPKREFKDSMMEMMYENEIKDGKDMEELLACYLLLNSAEYHDVIIQVFKQIWFDLMRI